MRLDGLNLDERLADEHYLTVVVLNLKMANKGFPDLSLYSGPLQVSRFLDSNFVLVSLSYPCKS